jgi:hypothetical protein
MTDGHPDADTVTTLRILWLAACEQVVQTPGFRSHLPSTGRQLMMLNTMTSEHTNDQPVRPRVAVVLAAGLLAVTAFQAALTLGAPLGAAAQGGTNPGQLPDALRLVTGLFVVVWFFAGLLVLARGGIALLPLPTGVTKLGTWVLVGLLGLGALMNFASSSPWERFGWGPFTFVLLILAVVLARSGLPADRSVTS